MGHRSFYKLVAAECSRELCHHQPMSAPNIDLDDVLLSEEAVSQWHALAEKAAVMANEAGVDGAVTDEVSTLNAAGELRVTASVGSIEIEMIVPPGHWQWINTA